MYLKPAPSSGFPLSFKRGGTKGVSYIVMIKTFLIDKYGKLNYYLHFADTIVILVKENHEPNYPHFNVSFCAGSGKAGRGCSSFHIHWSGYVR
jgi:hypothetical protein